MDRSMKMMKQIKEIIGHVIYFVITRLFPLFPKRVLKALMGVCRTLLLPGDTIESGQAVLKTGAVRIEGRWIDSVETKPSNEMDLVQRVVSSFCAAKQMQLKIPRPYRPSTDWGDSLAAGWQSYYAAMSRGDLTMIAAFLRNFFRNEGISGLWGNRDMFGGFCYCNKLDQLGKANRMREQYVVWRENLPSTPLEELDAPRVGNPWGYRFNGMLLYEPVFEYNFQAHYFDKLLRNLQTPVVVEIGGGFGGLAYHLLRCNPSIKYVGFDLPENIFIQTYYLSCTFPNARILTYLEDSAPLDSNLLDHYDIVLLPNFELPRVESKIADLIINVRSLSEMSYETITEYFMQIDRIGRLFFYHENIYKARRDKNFGIPSTAFPVLKKFIPIASSISRWPRYQSNSAYPCQENLFIHCDALSL